MREIKYTPPSEAADREKEGFSAVDFPFSTPAANVADITLTERYPESGYTLNTESEMFVRVLEGSIRLTYQSSPKNIEATLPAGSTVLVEKNVPYYWSPENQVRILVFSTPRWTPEQQRHIQ